MTRKKSKKYKIAAIALPIVALLAALVWYLRRHTVAVLSPAGEISQKERQLMLIAILLSAVVVLPVFAITIGIIVKYRETNHENGKKKIKYSPDFDHSRLLEGLWWGIPCAIILVLSVITWNSSHALDPYRALVSAKKPLTVQVICLDWKWLFIYPDQRVASVNSVEMPVNTPVDFQITSDAVMNSFWIPQLGGQIYAMPGMSTQLHLMADKTGSFYGSPANIAGEGFSRMTFTAKSVSQASFNSWVQSAQHAPKQLTQAAYNQLAKPSMDNPVTSYSQAPSGLYNGVVMKYMMPAMGNSSSNTDTQATPATSGSVSTQGTYAP